MSLTLAVVPLLAMLGLVLAYLVFAGLRSARIAHLKHEQERFTQQALEHDEALQRSLMDDLFTGNPPADRLDEFQRQRASILPGERLDNPAAWDVEDLVGSAQRKFSGQLAQVNHKTAVAIGAVSTAIVGVAIVCGSVLYNFHAGAPSAEPASFGEALSDQALPAAVNPLPDQAATSDDGARAISPLNPDGTTSESEDKRASASPSGSRSSKSPN
jgi:hypothetical protein